MTYLTDYSQIYANQEEARELMDHYFEPADTIRPADLLYGDLLTAEPNAVPKVVFYIVANAAYNGWHGKADRG